MQRKQLAAALGYAGLIPFVAGTAALFSSDPAVNGPALYSLTVYAAVILSFMGAVHWGLAMLHNPDTGHWQLGLSVLPALVAWASLSLQAPRGSLITLAIAFAVLLVADLWALAKHLVPSWYRGLRIPLTIVVIVSLGVAAWHLG